jgi:co-chaperonin GroES (HSP10)
MFHSFGGMKAVLDRVIFQTEKDTEDSVVLSNGVELYVETKYDPMLHARQWGTVVSVPEKLEFYKEFKDGIELSVGDKVWVHHFAVDKAQKFEVDKTLYRWLSYSMFFAVEKGDAFIPLGEFVFVRPLQRTDDMIGGLHNVKKGELSTRYGEVVYVNDYIRGEYGLNVGDVVFMKGTGSYDMKIGGELLYRMRARQLEAVLEGDFEVNK